MMRVAPFASVKSVSAHIVLQTVGGVRLRERDQLVVGVDRLRASRRGRCAIDDSDETRQPRIEHALDDRQHVRVHRDRARRASPCASRL